MKLKNIVFKLNKAIVFFLITVLSLSLFGCAEKNKESKKEDDPQVHYEEVVGKLVESGKSDYTIVYGENAGDAVQQAAKEIQDYVFKSTGAFIKISTDNGIKYTEESKVISLGQNKLLDESGLDLDFNLLKHDGYFIKTGGNSVFLAGGSDRGTLYSAYEYLEKFVGVKFLAYDYTYVPNLNEIVIYETDIIDNPAFNNRTFLSNKVMSDGQFAPKMRMVNEYVNIAERYGGGLGWFNDTDYIITDPVHSILSYVKPSDYYETHSEWFFTITENGTTRVADLDYSHTHLGITEDGHVDDTKDISPVKVAIESLKTFILNSTSDIKYFMIGQADEHECCQCRDCLNDEAKYKRSGMNIRFINAISEEIEKWMTAEGIDREIYVCTFAYQYSQSAPVDSDGQPLDETIIPRDNVIIRLAPIQANNYYSMTDFRQNDRTRDMFLEWQNVARKTMIWDYHKVYSHYFGYYPTMRAWNENLKLYQKMGAEYVFMQSAHDEVNDFNSNMETYVASKLLWNPNRNANEIRQEYIKYYYAGIDDLVTDFIENFEINYYYRMNDENLEDGNTNQDGYKFMDPQYYSVGFFNEQFALIDAMYERADELDILGSEREKFIKKVGRLKLYPLYMLIYNYDSYYFNDNAGKKAMVSEFFTLCDNIGVKRYGENRTISALKDLWGYKG